MSSSVLHGCCAIALLACFACSPRSASVPRHPDAEARNAPSTEKKPRKRRPTLVAPPPAYGNKIVREREARPGRELARGRAGIDSAEL
jgi:hypothetical protein